MTRTARTLTAAAIAVLPPAALFLWSRGRGFENPIEAFQAGVLAIGLGVLLGLGIAFATTGPARILESLGSVARRHRRGSLMAIGVLLCLIAAALAELGLRLAPQAERGVHQGGLSVVMPDPVLGYALRPGAVAEASYSSGGELVYEASYTVDNRGRRATETPAGSMQRVVAFFGGSFTFGEGLSDEDTLPSQFARVTAECMPLNFGVLGYGPNHVLAQLSSAPDHPGLERPPIGIYVFIDAHVGRCIGSMHVANRFGREAPYYVRRDGEMVLAGDFLHDRPVRAVVYWLLGKSEILRRLGFDWPPEGRAADLAFTADVIAACGREFERGFGSNEFTLLVYPGSSHGRAIAELVDKSHVRVLDYTDLFDPQEKGLSFLDDGHPTPRAIERLAERLAEDLEINH